MKQKNKLVICIFSLILVLTLGLFAWADSNGLWFSNQDIRVGTFGEDEQGTNPEYAFNTAVTFDNDIYLTNITNSEPSGSIIIQLG